MSLKDFLEAVEQTTPSLSEAEIDRYEEVEEQFSGNLKAGSKSKRRVSGGLDEELTDVGAGEPTPSKQIQQKSES